MTNKFEISETPTVENTTLLEKESLNVGKVNEIKGSTKLLKMTLNGEPYYHFSTVEFNNEIATKDSFIKIGNKVFYKGLVNKRMKNRLKLSNKY